MKMKYIKLPQTALGGPLIGNAFSNLKIWIFWITNSTQNLKTDSAADLLINILIPLEISTFCHTMVC